MNPHENKKSWAGGGSGRGGLQRPAHDSGNGSGSGSGAAHGSGNGSASARQRQRGNCSGNAVVLSQFWLRTTGCLANSG